MNFISTRNTAPAATLSQAIAAGLAPDGGLYVPDVLPAPRELAAGDDIDRIYIVIEYPLNFGHL